MVDGTRQQVSIPMNGYGTYYSRGTSGEQKGKKRSLFGGGVRTPFAIRWQLSRYGLRPLRRIVFAR